VCVCVCVCKCRSECSHAVWKTEGNESLSLGNVNALIYELGESEWQVTSKQCVCVCVCVFVCAFQRLHGVREVNHGFN